MRKNGSKGFTMAELLIVVAIIAVLVAVAIPVFNNQLEKSREAVDLSNIRNAYAAVSLYALENSEVMNANKDFSVSYNGYTLRVSGAIDPVFTVGERTNVPGWGIVVQQLPVKQNDFTEWRIEGEIGGISVKDFYMIEAEDIKDTMDIQFAFDPDSLELIALEIGPGPN